MKHLDTIQVSAVVTTTAGITLADVNPFLTCISLTVGIGFVLRKWYLMEKNKGQTK